MIYVIATWAVASLIATVVSILLVRDIRRLRDEHDPERLQRVAQQAAADRAGEYASVRLKHRQREKLDVARQVAMCREFAEYLDWIRELPETRR